MRARMVPIEDVRKALADARVTSRTKMEEALASAGASWGARAAALEARLADAEDRTQAAQAQVQAAEARAQAAEARLAQARQEAEEAVCQAEEAVGAATEAQQREAGSRAEAEAARKKTEELLCTVAELETRAVQAEAALQAATAQHEAAQVSKAAGAIICALGRCLCIRQALWAWCLTQRPEITARSSLHCLPQHTIMGDFAAGEVLVVLGCCRATLTRPSSRLRRCRQCCTPNKQSQRSWCGSSGLHRTRRIR